MSDLPIACELTADETTARCATLLPGLLAQADARETLPDGFRWRFAASGEFLAAAAETMNTERQCCRFLRFVLTVEPGGGPGRAGLCSSKSQYPDKTSERIGYACPKI